MRHTLHRLLFLTLGIILLGPLPAAWSADSETSPVLSRIAKTKTLRVGMTAGQPPFNVRSRSGEIIGMDVDLARLLARSMEVRLEIVEKPFTGLLPALEKGEVDLVMSGMTATLQRNLRVAFVGPYYLSGKTILTKSANVAAIQDASEMRDHKIRIAALAGSTSEDFVRAVVDEPDLTTTSNYDDAVSMLLDDEVDALVADAPICMLSILRYPDSGLVTLKKPLTVEPIGIAVAPNDPLLLNLVENYLKAASAMGALDALRERWFNSGAWLAQLP